MKVEIFEGVNNLSHEAQSRGEKYLDKKINTFLLEHQNIEIKHIKQSSASCGERDRFGLVTTISIWYEEV